MKTGRDVHAVARLQHELYLFGGVRSTQMECFDPETKQWRDVAPLKTGRDGCAAATLDGRLYVMGGTQFCGGMRALSSVECYHPDTNRWHDAPPMSTKRTACAAGVLKGQLYVVGGSHYRYLASVERFDARTQKWTSVAPLNTARCNHGLVFLEGKLYAVGGTGHSISHAMISETLSTVECYDPLEDKWTFVAPMSQPRQYHGVAVLEGKIYAAGGVYGACFGHNRLGTVECYDPHMNEWKPVSRLSLPRFAGFLVAV
jgi:N-acetylneuraminic acid mutarotase